MVNERNIYVFSDARKDAEALMLAFAKKNNFNILTTKREVKKLCIDSGIPCTIVSNRFFKFKKQIRKIPIDLVILPSDNYHFIYNYIARKYLSVVIQHTILLVNCTIREKRFAKLNRTVFFWLYKIVGMNVNSCNFEILSYEPTVKAFISNVIKKMMWGHKTSSALPGAFADKVMIPSEYSKKMYLESNICEKKIAVTGILQDDDLYNVWKNKKKLTKEFDIVIISQPFNENDFDYPAEIEKLIKLCKNYQIAIKLHPRNSLDDFGFCQKYNNVKIFDFRHVSSKKLILHSSIAVGTYSSYLMVPLIREMPVVFWDFKSKKFLESYYNEPILIGVGTDEVYNKINEVFQNGTKDIVENQNKFLKKFGFFDGRCEERILKEIQKLIKR